MIKVQPVRELRVAFARWAVAQTSKVRTCSTSEFAVPPHLFTHMPERLLIGSVVDGHPYVSPADDETMQWRTAVPGEPLPPVPDSEYPPGAVQLPEPERQLAATTPETVEAALTAVLVATEVAAGGDSSTPADEPEGPPYACGLCPREFTTARGRDTHRRQVHREA
ncbi:hypothetical protein [Streptomyces griseoruber]|uniref:hypothetical protein n=1 Tax=Streptomyces griseoruber TaxID=1943 RepID=UPI0037A62796